MKRWQDTNLRSYVPKANMDHTISGQGIGIITLDHSVTTPVQMMYAVLYMLYVPSFSPPPPPNPKGELHPEK